MAWLDKSLLGEVDGGEAEEAVDMFSLEDGLEASCSEPS